MKVCTFKINISTYQCKHSPTNPTFLLCWGEWGGEGGRDRECVPPEDGFGGARLWAEPARLKLPLLALAT